MSTIEETVRQALRDDRREDYMAYAGRVIEYLTTRERDISDKLMDAAETELDIERSEVRNILVDVDMEVTPETAPTNGEAAADQDSLAQIMATLEQIAGKVDGLAQFARQNGYTG